MSDKDREATRREFLGYAAAAMVVAPALGMAGATPAVAAGRAAPELEQLDRVTARFAPRTRDDLRPGVEDWIGREGVWVAWKRIAEGQPYGGEWAMLPEGDVFLPVRWTPLGDLEVVGGGTR